MLPNFLIIGARRAGTTSLYHYLRAHPQVFMPPEKELNFFVPNKNWTRGLRWYEQRFEQADDALAIGEASPSYTRFPRSQGIPALIAQVLPDARFIYLVREPIERMVSHYLQNLRYLWESELSAETALLGDRRYIDGSSYAMQVEQYMLHFPRKRLLIVMTEDLRNARTATMERIYRFLGVDSTTVPANLNEEYNATNSEQSRAVRPTASVFSRNLRRLPGYRRLASATPHSLKKVKRRLATSEIGSTVRISHEVRQELERRLRPDMERLRDYMGEDFDGWGIG
jgi:hypothetical protein